MNLANLAALADNHNWHCIKGNFDACVPKSLGNGTAELEDVGTVSILVARSGKYLICYHDENDVLRGIFDRGSGEEKLLVGAGVDIADKNALVEGIAVEVAN